MMKRLIFIFLLSCLFFCSYGQDLTIKDPYTNDHFIFKETMLYHSGIKMNDNYLDGVIYIKKNGKFYKRVTSGFIDLRWFGPQNFSRDFSSLLTKVSKIAKGTGNNLFISKEIKNLYLDRNTDIYSSIISDGVQIKMPCKHNRFFNIQSSNVTVKGVIMQIDNSIKLTNAPIAIEINGFNNINIINNTILNGRINSSSIDKSPKNITIDNNQFICDFSNFDNFKIQNDILYLYNISNLYIRSNTFKAKNVNRVMKISSSSKKGSFTSRNIHILGNNIHSVTNSKKQVIDLFQHTQDVFISENIFSSYGHFSIIENKTTGKRKYRTNLNVNNNTFITDGTVVRVFGSFGEKNNNQSGYQDLTFKNNKINTNKSEGVILNAAHFNKVDVLNNEFTGPKSNTYLRIAGIDTLLINGNKFANTKLLFTDENKIGESDYFDHFNSIIIKNNEFNISDGIIRVINSKNIKSMKILNNKIPASENDILFLKNSNVKELNRPKIN